MAPLRYEGPHPIPRSELLAILNAGTREQIQDALVSAALFESDISFVYPLVLRCARSLDAMIRGTAILCLGHLARLHRTLPDDEAVTIVREGLRDQDAWVRGHSDSALEDFDVFAPSLAAKVRA